MSDMVKFFKNAARNAGKNMKDKKAESAVVRGKQDDAKVVVNTQHTIRAVQEAPKKGSSMLLPAVKAKRSATSDSIHVPIHILSSQDRQQQLLREEELRAEEETKQEIDELNVKIFYDIYSKQSNEALAKEVITESFQLKAMLLVINERKDSATLAQQTKELLELEELAKKVALTSQKKSRPLDSTGLQFSFFSEDSSEHKSRRSQQREFQSLLQAHLEKEKKKSEAPNPKDVRTRRATGSEPPLPLCRVNLDTLSPEQVCNLQEEFASVTGAIHGSTDDDFISFDGGFFPGESSSAAASSSKSKTVTVGTDTVLSQDNFNAMIQSTFGIDVNAEEKKQKKMEQKKDDKSKSKTEVPTTSGLNPST